MTEPSSIRFGIFELDLEAGELRRNGAKIRLQEQPFQILVSLLERPGKVVTRDELRKKLWPADTFVDFDHGLNAAIRRLREALDDSADTPRFVETVARHGYRFIAPVDVPRLPAAEGSERIPPAASVPPQTSSSAVIAAAKQHKLGVAAGLFAGLIVLSAAAFGVYSLLHRPAPTPFQKFATTQVTNTGKAARAAISPDGRYVLSVMDDSGLESLWLRNVPTGSDTQVIPPSVAHYESLTFSPDGNYIYFRRIIENAGSDLYRSPILGGAPQMVVRDLFSDITFSPDAQRIAYIRWDEPEVGKYRILTASLDGSDEKVLQIGARAEKEPHSFAWSPRGDEIACSLYLTEQGSGAIDFLDARTGKSRRLITFKDKFPAEIRWSPDGRMLFTMYTQTGANGHRPQIGFLRPAGVDIEPITRDTNRYTTLTLSADGRTLATVLARSYATVSVLSKLGPEFGEPRPLLSQTNQFDEENGLSWAADGTLLVSNAGRLLKLGADGKSQAQLLADSSASIFTPSSCGTNYLVLSWAGHGSTNSESIWRTNADGSSPLKLTDGKLDRGPVCSPDQKWVYYDDDVGRQISRVPLDGSDKKEVLFSNPQGYLWGLGVSPDGKKLAIEFTRAPEWTRKIAVFDLASSSLSQGIDASRYMGGMRFTPDGKSVVYLGRENSVDNIWVQPLDGSAGHAITNFKSEQIWSFGLSPDGKSLAILRGHYDSDVVLLQESKP